MSNYVSKLYKNAIKAEQEIVKASISDKPFNWCYGEYTEGNQKYFTDDVEYRVHDRKSPIKIYKGEIFMGIIMPKLIQTYRLYLNK